MIAVIAPDISYFQSLQLKILMETIAVTIKSDGKWDVYLINVDGTGFANLTGGRPGDYVLPNWSADGDRIVLSFRDRKDGRWEIGVMDAEGGPVTTISSGPYPAFLAQW